MSKIIQRQHLPKTFLSFLILVVFSSLISIYFNFNPALAHDNINHSLSGLQIIDPNPKLIDNKSGNLINNITLAYNIHANKAGTIADGISKLLLVTSYKNPINFSIADDTNLSKGTLSCISDNSNNTFSSLHSSVIIKPKTTKNGTCVVAVYTPPPTYINSSSSDSSRIINILVQDINNSSVNTTVPLSLYRVPVVLVHGLWSDPIQSWIKTNFNSTLVKDGFKVYLANYSAYNAETFDPYNITNRGNHGIDSIRNITNFIMNYYHDRGIAASQVDIIGHSMGGLLARGFVQQTDYKNQTNYMHGYIHRLITIGTPHYGGQLAKILLDHQNEKYCINKDNITIWEKPICDSHNITLLEPLKDIFNKYDFKNQIDKGGVEALAPGSKAYSNMCQTNVPSHAIAGSWVPKANDSHNFIQWMYRNITHNPQFDLDINGFNGTRHGDNDLQVNITSQLGGLPIHFRIPNSSILPDKSEVYYNTVHYPDLLSKSDTSATSELNSTNIQKDVAILLQSPQVKFADAIGEGSSCQISK